MSSLPSLPSSIPKYGERKGWVPRCEADFGGGGAYPEIDVVQYPRDMGRQPSKKSNALPVKYDAQGNIEYDLILRQSSNKNKVIYSKLQDLLPSEVLNPEELAKPDEEEVAKTTEETKSALENLIKAKISASLPVRHAEKQGEAQYIRYTPSQQLSLEGGSSSSNGQDQRIIRIVEVQKDPLEPPRFKINKKIPQAPPSPPPPVMHSPTRKLTVQEQQEWRIPPCISNWKNARGYTIPLDKRLAADGRGLQQAHINENFAKLSEALYIADRKAREAVEMRSQMERKLAQKEKEKKEETLRQLAEKARKERAGIRRADDDSEEDSEDEVTDRDKIRRERQKDRQRERNLMRAAPNKRSKLERERERDISEQIALGMANPRTNPNEVQYDQRLFNQNKGLASGFGDEDDYAVYDKPWRSNAEAKQSLYRPSKKAESTYDEDMEKLGKNRFVPDKGFSGADRSAKRDGPVQFEKQDDDPFGLDEFLTKVKQASKQK